MSIFVDWAYLNFWLNVFSHLLPVHLKEKTRRETGFRLWYLVELFLFLTQCFTFTAG